MPRAHARAQPASLGVAVLGPETVWVDLVGEPAAFGVILPGRNTRTSARGEAAPIGYVREPALRIVGVGDGVGARTAGPDQLAAGGIAIHDAGTVRMNDVGGAEHGIVVRGGRLRGLAVAWG